MPEIPGGEKCVERDRQSNFIRIKKRPNSEGMQQHYMYCSTVEFLNLIGRNYYISSLYAVLCFIPYILSTRGKTTTE